MKLDNVLVINSKLIIDEVDDEIIVFNEETQNTHILNGVGGFLLKNAENLSVAQVIDKLYCNLSCDEQNLYSKEEITSDCIAFMEEMINQGLLYII
ncbi:PqqD family peptide modification chaperone [Romboutsia ilealis]|jgi:hypothetical protein|uniref:PqqD family peptide modification chaperone n=1 Tax=Romboutsia ilealis TaxID=1115758 RepID=UPI0027148577|nr:PqqD family peptide modification chaperone [Romboutsia ilealis]